MSILDRLKSAETDSELIPLVVEIARQAGDSRDEDYLRLLVKVYLSRQIPTVAQRLPTCQTNHHAATVMADIFVSAGDVPPRQDIRDWLTEGMDKIDAAPATLTA